MYNSCSLNPTVANYFDLLSVQNIIIYIYSYIYIYIYIFFFAIPRQRLPGDAQLAQFSFGERERVLQSAVLCCPLPHHRGQRHGQQLEWPSCYDANLQENVRLILLS